MQPGSIVLVMIAVAACAGAVTASFGARAPAALPLLSSLGTVAIFAASGGRVGLDSRRPILSAPTPRADLHVVAAAERLRLPVEAVIKRAVDEGLPRVAVDSDQLSPPGVGP